jgi:hypothetical protein
VQRQWESLLAEAVRVRDEENYSADDDGTILITKKGRATQPPPTARPAPTPEAKESPPTPEAAPSTSGMNIITLEEMVEADTTLIPKPGNKGHPPAGPKK